MYTWNLISPRLGVTTKLTADGRTILRASYGRFHQGILTAEVGPTHPGITPVTTMAFDAATGGYTRLVSVVDSTLNVQVDPHMRAPLTDEYSVGVDREVGRGMAVALAYIRKTGSDYIAYTDVGGMYRTDTRTLPDGQTLPVHVLVNSTADRRFFLTNPEGYSLTYNGLVMALDKRRSHGWQAFGSYTYSRVDGLQVSSGTTPGGAQSSTVAPVAPFVPNFGRDPNDLTNARGRLPNDRPHMFKVMGSVDVPKLAWCLRPICSASAGSRGRLPPRFRCRRVTSGSCSNRAARAGCHHNRCSTCASRGGSSSAAWAASSCSSTCSMCSTTPPRRIWRRTTSSVRTSPGRSSSWIRGA